jgi:uncharacterized membrane protein
VDAYSLLKLVHVVAVVAFLGNIATGVFWKRHAERAGDARLVAHAFDGIIRSDRLFTLPGVVVIVATGLAAAVLGGFPILRTGWIRWSLVLFSASGLAYSVRVAPLQRRILALASGGGAFDWERYHALARAWEAWGAFALLAPLGALALMVLKPG